MDIQAHAGETRRAFTHLRDWLANVSRRRSIPGAPLLLAAYDRFLTDKPVIAASLGFDPAEIPYVDYENMVTTWLLTARPAA